MGYLKGRYSCTITQVGPYWWTKLKDVRTQSSVTLVTEGFPTNDVANSLPSSFGLTGAAYTAAKNAIIDAQLSVIRARTTVDDADIASMMADGQVEGQWGSDAELDHMPAETFDQLYSAATHDGTVNAAMHEEFEARGLDTAIIPPMPARPRTEQEEMAERIRTVQQADTKSTAGRMSIKKSHRGEGENFID